MKRISLALGMLVMALMAVGLHGTVMAKSSPTLPAPTGLTCDFTASPTIDWDTLDGATKYSVEVTAGYDTTVPPDGVVDVTLTLSFGTTASELNLLFSTLAQDFGSGPIYPSEVEVQVKGLNPPGKSQNNPFTDPAASCTLPASS